MDFDIEIGRAFVRATEFLRSKLADKALVTVGYDRANALSSLRLAGFTIDMLSELGTDDLVSEIDKHGLHNTSAGRVAYYVQGVLAICKDPTAFSGYDLIQRLKGGLKEYPQVGFDHPFPYSLAVLALCSSGHGHDSYLDYALKIRNLVDPKTSNTKHSGDTMAMATMALSCMYDKGKGNRKSAYRKVVKRTRRRTVSWLLRNQNSDGSFGNSITTALVIQALLSAGIKPRKFHCRKATEFMLNSQKHDGSLVTANLMSTAQVMPALIGAIPSDIMLLKCPNKETGNKNTIKVCVRLEFLTTSPDNTTAISPPSVSVTVLNGTNAHDILKAAEKQHICYQLTTTMTAWGQSITSLCAVRTDPANKKYWMMYSDTHTAASAGIDTFRPKNGSCVIFKYEKLNFR